MLCGRPTLEEFAVADGWDFKPVFAGVRDFLGDSDYVVGNLETPITLDGGDLTHERWCFNSPAQFAEAVKWAGVDFVTTANNHCLDRGTRGIVSTIRALDAVGLRHTGTFADQESAAVPNIVEAGGFRLGFLSYTYGTNAFSNHEYLKPEESFMVNLFQEQELAEPLARKWMWERESPEAKIYEGMERKRWPENLTLPVYERVAAHEAQRAHLADDVRRLRTQSPDFTVMGMHTGGQYNDVASRWTKELADEIRAVARRFTGRPCEDLAIAPEYFLAPDGTPSA